MRESHLSRAIDCLISEEDFTTQVVELCQTLGWLVTHSRPARTSKGWVTPIQGHAGFPDLVMTRGERVLFAELKSEKGKLTANQEAWLNGLRLSKDVEVFVWFPHDWDQIAEVLR